MPSTEKDAANKCSGVGCSCYGNVELHDLPPIEKEAGCRPGCKPGGACRWVGCERIPEVEPDPDYTCECCEPRVTPLAGEVA